MLNFLGMKKICFVCTGNTCRSPMAENLLKDKLKKQKIKLFQILSAGIMADGSPTSSETIAVLRKNGIPAKPKKSKTISASLLKKNDILFLTMTTGHKQHIRHNNVFSLGEFIGGADIPDPYGRSPEAYENCFSQLDAYTNVLAEKIQKINEEPKTKGEQKL